MKNWFHFITYDFGMLQSVVSTLNIIISKCVCSTEYKLWRGQIKCKITISRQILKVLRVVFPSRKEA